MDDDLARLLGPDAVRRAKEAELKPPVHVPVLNGEFHHPAMDSWPADDWAHRYFAAYCGQAGLGTIKRSCRVAKIDKNMRTRRLEDDELFRIVHEAADEELREAFEYVLTDRVLNGVEKPVYQGGRMVGMVREVDNRLLQWVLERLMPEKYNLDTRLGASGSGGPAEFEFAMGEKPRALGKGKSQES